MAKESREWTLEELSAAPVDRERIAREAAEADLLLLRWLHAEAVHRAETAEAALDALRDAHLIPYVDEDHQGGNCADIVMSLLARAIRAEAEQDRERSSRQAWAVEALRWREYTGVPAKDKGVDWIVAFGAEHHDYPRVCACISDDRAAILTASGMFTRPVCAVHEQKDASDA